MSTIPLPLGVSPRDKARLDEVEQARNSGAPGLVALIELLSTPSWAVRRAVVNALSSAGDAATDVMCEALHAKREDEGRIAGLVDALATSKSAVEPAVIALLESNDAAVVCDAAQILGRRRVASAVPALIQLTAHSDDNVALSAIEALGRVGGERAVDCLLALSATGNFFRVFPAIDVLGRCQDDRAVPVLVALLREPFNGPEAARALARLGHPAAALPLVELLASGSGALARVAAVSLSDIHARCLRRFGSARGVELAVGQHPRRVAIQTRVLEGIRASDPREQVAFARISRWLFHDDVVLEWIALLDAAPDVAENAAEALRQHASDDPRLVEALRQASSARRRLLLPLLKPAAWVAPYALECLSDADGHVQVLACDLLARIGDPSVVPTLFARLKEPDLGISQAITGAIQSLGSAETEPLALRAASSEDPVERRAALRILCYFANPSALDLVIECARGADDRLRDIAIAGLPLFEDARIPELLLELSHAPLPRTRAAAVRAMGHAAEDPRLLGRALEALADGDPWVRYFACQALGRWGHPAATDAVMQALQDPAGQVRVGAVDALAKLSNAPAREALSQAARSSDLEVRRSALVALGSAPHASFLPVLIEALDSDDAATRLVAISSLARYTGAEPMAAICRTALGDPDESVRDSAIELLAGQSLAPGVEALLSLLWRDPDSERVIGALGRRIDGRVSALRAALEAADPRTASAIVAALSRIDTAESHAALLAALQLPNAAARRAAAEALTATRSPDALDALVQAASHDPEPEVRRICALALP